MKVVVTIATIDAAHGGPARTVPTLCREISKVGVEVEVITVAERGKAAESLNTAGFTATVIESEGSRYRPQTWRREFEHALRSAVTAAGSVILYDVGLWLPSNHFAAVAARRTN